MALRRITHRRVLVERELADAAHDAKDNGLTRQRIGEAGSTEDDRERGV